MAGFVETAVVLDQAGRAIHWHRPSGATATSLPDSRALWEVLWAHRHELGGVAHTHPGAGPPVPSHEDLTTFAAIEAALGRRLRWWIVTADQVRCFRWTGPEPLTYGGVP